MTKGNDPLQKRALPPDRRTKGGSFARAAGSFVPKIAAKAFEKFGFHTAEIMMQWPAIAGADIAKWTRPERIRWPRPPQGADTTGDEASRPGGALVLRVEPARALDIEYRSGEIIDRINRYFGYRAVETIKLIQAPITEAAPSATRSASRPGPEAGADAPMSEDPLQTALAALEASVTAARQG